MLKECEDDVAVSVADRVFQVGATDCEDATVARSRTAVISWPA
jgi:hypothetical protein